MGTDERLSRHQFRHFEHVRLFGKVVPGRVKNVMQRLGVGYHQVVFLSRDRWQMNSSIYINERNAYTQAPTTAPRGAEMTHPLELGISHFILIENVTLVSYTVTIKVDH